MSSSKTKDTSLALIVVTNAMQMRISCVTKAGDSVDVGLALTRIEAQKLANALLDYAVPEYANRRKESKCTFMATYDPHFKESHLVRLTATDLQRGAASHSRRGGK
jgi:hypothetical protein